MVTWKQLQSSFMDDPTVFWEYWQDRGLDCPLEVFIQLFYDQVGVPGVPSMTCAVDWAQIRWAQETLSGHQLCAVHVDRQFDHAVDEAYRSTIEYGITDDRPAVVEGWARQRTWMEPPILVTGEVIGTDYRHVLLVGNSRIGNLWGLLGRGELSHEQTHPVWIGRPVALASAEKRET